MNRTGRTVAGGLLFLSLVSISMADLARGESDNKAGEALPVNITSDRMEYFNDDNLIVFTGSAVAVRGEDTLKAERMEVTLEGDAEERSDNSITQIVALDTVSFRQYLPEKDTERFATGQKAVYNADEGSITLTGDPKAWEEKNVLVGEKMTFFLDDSRLLVEGAVGVTIYPGEKQEDIEGGEEDK